MCAKDDEYDYLFKGKSSPFIISAVRYFDVLESAKVFDKLLTSQQCHRSIC